MPLGEGPIPNTDSFREVQSADPAMTGGLTWSESGSGSHDGESSSFEYPNRLDAFALMSIELMNFVQLASSVEDPTQANHFRAEYVSRIEERTTAINGVVESVRDNILFIAFPYADSLEKSIDQAVQTAFHILQEPVIFHRMPLKIRIGMDIEQAAQRKPMTSATERSVATAGSIVVSEGIYDYVKQVFHVESVGPLRVGNRMVTFYQLSGVKKPVIPQDDILMDPVPRYGAQADSSPSPPQGNASTYPSLNTPLPPHSDHHASPHVVPTMKSEVSSPTRLHKENPSEQASQDRPSFPQKGDASYPELLYNPVNEEPSPLLMLEHKDSSELSPDKSPFGGEHSNEVSLEGVNSEVLMGIDSHTLISAGVSSDRIHQVLNVGSAVPDLSLPTQITEESLPGNAAHWSPPQGTFSDTVSSSTTLKSPASQRDKSLAMRSGYAPPLYGMHQKPREATHSYESVVGALIHELRGFMSDENGKGRIVTLSSGEGVGKSWIINNLVLKELFPDPRNPQLIWFPAHNYACYGRDQIPLFPWIEMFYNAIPLVLEGAEASQIRTWISQTLNQVYEGNTPEDVLGFFGSFLSASPLKPVSLDSLGAIGNIEHYLGDFLIRMSQQMPLMIFIEDVDQADVASLDLLVKLVRQGLLDHHICLLLTHSHDFYPEGEFHRMLSLNPHTEFVLSSLNPEEIVHFMNAGPFAGTLDTLSTTHVDNLMAYSKGQTLYLFEAIAYLQVNEVFLVDPESGKLSPNPDFDQSALRLPATLEEMITHRFNMLTDDERYALQAASVLGERFTLKVLIDICQYDLEKMREILEGLTVQQFIFSDFRQITGYFRHRILWKTVYEGMDVQTRDELHKLASEYLEELTKKDITVYPALVAYHAQHGGMRNRAFQYWNMAGVYCTQVGSLVGSNMMMSKALELLDEPEDDDTKALTIRLKETMGVLNLDQDPVFSMTLLEPVVAWYRQTSNPAKHVEALGYLASAHEGLGNYYVGLELLDQVLQQISKVDYPQEYVATQISRLEYLYKLGRLQKALDLLDYEIQPLWDMQAGSSRQSVYDEAYLGAQVFRAEIALTQCNNMAFQIIEHTLKEAVERNLDDVALVLKLTRTRGFLFKGNYESCQRSLYGVLDVIEQQPDAARFMGQWGQLAILYHSEMGDWKSANDILMHSVYQAETLGDYISWVMLNIQAGVIAMSEGRPKDARHILEAMASESSERRFATCALVCWRHLAANYMALGEPDQALDVAVRALEIARKEEVNNIRESYLMALTKARIQMTMGDIKAGGGLLQEMWPKVKATGFHPIIADYAAAIGELYHIMGNQTPVGEKREQHRARSVEFYDIALNQWRQLKNRYQAEQTARRMEQPTFPF